MARNPFPASSPVPGEIPGKAIGPTEAPLGGGTHKNEGPEVVEDREMGPIASPKAFSDKDKPFPAGVTKVGTVHTEGAIGPSPPAPDVEEQARVEEDPHRGKGGAYRMNPETGVREPVE